MTTGMAGISSNQGAAQFQGAQGAQALKGSEGGKLDSKAQQELDKVVQDLIKKLLDPMQQAKGAAQAPGAQQPAGQAAPAQQAQQAQGAQAPQGSSGGDMSIEELIEKLKKLLRKPGGEEELVKLAQQNPQVAQMLQALDKALSGSGAEQGFSGGDSFSKGGEVSVK